MSSGSCSRCGRVSELEYGPDGLGYCSSCAFYGLNKQCWRCRMYLPATELQQYNGQFTCPYCIQDLRDADRKAQETPQKKPPLEVYRLPEQCERCGRDLKGRVYIWNGERLCRKCMEYEQESKWGLVGGGPMHAPMRISLKPEEERKNRSIIEAAISELLITLRLKKRPVKEVIIYDHKMPIQLAKPMTEKAMPSVGQKGERKPQAEGLMVDGQEGGAKAAKPAPEARSEQPFEFEKPATVQPKGAAPPAPAQKEKKAPKRKKKRKEKAPDAGILSSVPVKSGAEKKKQ